MNNKIITIFCLVWAFMFAACSSEEAVVENGTKVNVANRITFQFGEANYQPGSLRPTAGGTRASVTSQTIRLSNGATVEMSIEPDTEGTTSTRATKPASDGHYKIYAVDASGVRHDGITGTISGGTGVFEPDANSDLMLNAGETYTFICINDAVEDNGTSLKVMGGTINPMVGKTVHTVSTNPHDVISFNLEHQLPRVRLRLASYTAPVANATVKLSAGMNFGAGFTYDTKFDTHTVISDPGTGFHSNAVNLTADQTITYKSIGEDYTSTSDYMYADINGTLLENFAFNFTGTLHGFSIPALMPFPPSALHFLPNHSYLVKFKYKIDDPLCLYQDGTVGYLGDKGTRTPIALVVDEKTATTKGMAIALTDAGNTIFTSLSAGSPTWKTAIKDSDPMNDMNGYEYTWLPNYYDADYFSAVGEAVPTVPLGEWPKEDGTYHHMKLSYYIAAHYTPLAPVTGSNIGKWFLPSTGEWKKFLKKFTNVQEANIPSYYQSDEWQNETVVPWDMTRLDFFTKANGYFNSTPGQGGGYAVSGHASGEPIYIRMEADGVRFIYDAYHGGVRNAYVRSFVYF